MKKTCTRNGAKGKAGRRLWSLLLAFALLFQLGLPALATEQENTSPPDQGGVEEIQPPEIQPPVESQPDETEQQPGAEPDKGTQEEEMGPHPDEDVLDIVQNDRSADTRAVSAQSVTVTVTARYSSNRITLTGATAGTTYDVERSNAENGSFIKVGTVTVAAGQTTGEYIDETAETATQYYYRASVAAANPSAAARAPYETGLNALVKTAVFQKVYPEAGQEFKNTYSEDVPAQEEANVLAMEYGTVIMKMKLQVRGKVGSICVLGTDSPNYFLGISSSGGKFGFRYSMGAAQKSTVAGDATMAADQFYTSIYAFSPNVDGTTGTRQVSFNEKFSATSFTPTVNDPIFFNGNGTNLRIGGKAVTGTSLVNSDATFTLSYVLVTSEALSEAEVKAITGNNPDPVLTGVGVSLSGTTVAPAAGSVVGEVTFTGEGSDSAKATLPVGEGDNSLFVLEGNTLKVGATPLTDWSSYTVVLSADVAGTENYSFTVQTTGGYEDPIIEVKQDTVLSGGAASPDYTADALRKLQGLDDLTVMVNFTDTRASDAVGSLFSVSNNANPAAHFHVYTRYNDYSYFVSYELRGAAGDDIRSARGGLIKDAPNAIAFVADSSDYTLKLFVNGRLASTNQFTEDSYRMLTDIIGLNSVRMGLVDRGGNNSTAYGFQGTVHDMTVYGRALTDEELITYTASREHTPPEKEPFYAYDATGSGYFRIPALLTLNDGDVMAAIDARYSGPADSPANLDTAVNFLRTGANDWEGPKVVNSFIDYPNGSTARGTSASFIDPQIIQLPATAEKYPGRILMLVDAYPYGSGINTLTGNSYSGMVQVGNEWYLALTTGNREQFSSFTHYLKPDPNAAKEGTQYTVCLKSDNTATEYTTDAHFNLYKSGVAQTTVQMDTGDTIPLNLFYETSPLKPYPTSYLWLTHSDDEGVTWSAPKIIGNEQRTATNGNFLGCGPGRGHVVQQGNHAGRVMFSVYDEGVDDNGTGNRNERASTLYSDDGGDTWTLGKRTTMAATNSPGKSSESQIVELPDGTLRMYARGNTGSIGYTDSTDGGETWAPMVQDPGLGYCGNCMISVINYSKSVDGKPALILSAPEGSGRNNGIIRVGLINGEAGSYTVDWKYRLPIQSGSFVYSCLTELSNGDVGILYEQDTNSSTPGVNPRYREYTIDRLTKGDMVRFALTENSYQPGGPVTVELELGTAVDLTASQTVLTAGLTVQYPGNNLPDGKLTYSRAENGNKTLVFTGALPSSQGSYHFRVSIPAALALKAVGGAAIQFPGPVSVTGTAGTATPLPAVTVTARYLSNRISWVEGTTVPTGYELQRAETVDGSYEKLADFQPGQVSYEYVDETALTGTRYWYRLVLTGTDKTVAPVQAAHATGLDALLETAVLRKVYTTDKAFNGSRVEVLADATTNTAALNTVTAMNTGTVVTMAQLTGAKPTSFVSVLGSNKADCFVGIDNAEGRMRFDFGGYRAYVLGSNYTLPGYHTAVYTCDGASVTAAMDGNMAPFSSTSAFFARANGLTALTVGGNKDGDTQSQQLTGKIAYILITGEKLSRAEAVALSQSKDFPASDTHPDYTDGANLAGMFNTDPDNTWVFTGGAAAQGSFADNMGARNYIGEFEEYIRWAKAGTPITRQRHVTSTARAGQDLQAALDSFDSRIVPIDPKAVVYLVSKEDWSKGQAGLEDFKTALNAFIEKCFTLKDGNGLVAIQTPYAVAGDNTNTALYAQAVKDVVNAQGEKRTSIMVVDHYAQTDTDAFKQDNLNVNGTPNPKGHLALGRQLSLALFGSDADYPSGAGRPIPPGYPNDRVPVATPKSYLNTPAAVTAAADSLSVTIPDGAAATSWGYELALESYTLSGSATGKSFTVSALPAGETYTLTLTATGNSMRLPVMVGTVSAGTNATMRTTPLTTQQQALAALMARDQSLTWLFMGDSITHGAAWMPGYDSISQSFEKFVKDDLDRTDDIIINTANSGANTATTMENLEQRLTKFSPDVVSVMLGTNDAAGHAVPVLTYKTNLESILAKIEEKGAIAIIRTPLPSDAGNRGEYIPEYAAAAKEVAANHPNVIVVDQYEHWYGLLTTMPFLWGKLYGESTGKFIHPNPSGQLVMTHQFLRDTGLWRDDSAICNLFYEIGLISSNSAIKPALATTASTISLDAAALAGQYGKVLASMELKAITDDGRSYSVSGAPTGALTLANLPTDMDYIVILSAQEKTTATAVTFASQRVHLSENTQVSFDVLLDNLYPTALSVGDTVGALSVSVTAPAGAYTYTLVSGEGDTDNGAFSIDDTTLKVAQALAAGQTYHIRVQAKNGEYTSEGAFTLLALSAGRIFREENVVLPGGTVVDLSNKPYANQVYQMEEGTFIVRYVQTTPGSFFGVANKDSAKAGNHFHLYNQVGDRNNRNLGMEVRNANGTSVFSYSGVDYVLTTGRVRDVYDNRPMVNTLAVTADRTAGTYKVFANGALVLNITPAEYKFLKDIEGLNSLTLGGVMRNGAPAYATFDGTIHYIEAYAAPLSDEEVLRITGETDPGDYIFKAGDGANSNYFRIPSLTTLADGTLVAAADARHSSTQDSKNNIDTAVSYSTDGGKTWSDPTMPLHFDDFADNPQRVKFQTRIQVDASASYIDPVLTTAINPQTGAERLFMLIDAFQSGGQTVNSQAGSGFKEIDGVKYLALKKSGESGYSYTVRANGVIYNDATNSPTQYSVNSKYELLDNGVPLTIKQKRADLNAERTAFTVTTTDVDVKMNIMYSGAIFNPLPTSYLYLTHSDDGGRTWSDPVNLNGMVKEDSMMFFGVGPGRGLQIQNGEHAGRILLPVYEVYMNPGTMIVAPNDKVGQNQCRVIYSDDFGVTWKAGERIAKGDSPTMTESQVVEMPDGTLRIFARATSTKLAMSASVDGGVTWTAGALQDDLPGIGGSGCQISVINYNGLIDGKPAVILSGPTLSSRRSGVVRIGLINENPGATGVGRYTIDWKYSYSFNPEEYFAYSCLTGLPGGGVGLIYENFNAAQPVDVMHFQRLSLDTLKGKSTVQITVKGPQDKAQGTVSGGGNWNLGETAFVSATPGVGYEFAGWQNAAGETVSTDVRYQFVAVKGQLLQAVFRLAADTQKPTAPTNVAASAITQTGATMNWTASTDNIGVAGYEVYLNGTLKGTVTETEYRFTGLAGDTAYTVKVVALDVAGNRSDEATVNFRTTKEAILTGHVYYHGGAPASGLTVKLYKGSELVKQSTTSTDGTYALTAFWGTYMLCMEVGAGVTHTQPVTVPVAEPLNITLPDGKLGSSLVVEESAKVPAVAAGGLNDLFDATDKALVKSNPNYRVSYELGVAEAKVQDEIGAITSAAGGKTVSTLLDITLAKTTVTGTTVRANVSESGRLLQIMLPFDAAWQGKDLTVYRYHDGAVDTITTQRNGSGEFLETVGGQLILHVKKFSTYAVAYSESSGGGNTGGGGSSSGSVGQFTITAIAEGGGKITPASAKADKGASVVVTIKPDAGMTLRQLLLDGRSVSVAGPDEKGVYTYTLKNIQGDHVLRAVFMSAADDVLKKFADLSNHWARDAIRFTLEAGLMKGTAGTSFSPNGQTDRATIAVILYRMAGEPKVEGSSTFTDVPEGAWYASAVTWCAKQGIIQGAGKNLYAPNRPVTRQELAVFFYRYTVFAGGDTLGDAVKMDSYSDSDQVSAWAREAMAWCVESGVLGGSDNGRLLPNTEATRGELAVMLQRLHVFLGK